MADNLIDSHTKSNSLDRIKSAFKYFPEWRLIQSLDSVGVGPSSLMETPTE